MLWVLSYCDDWLFVANLAVFWCSNMFQLTLNSTNIPIFLGKWHQTITMDYYGQLPPRCAVATWWHQIMPTWNHVVDWIRISSLILIYLYPLKMNEHHLKRDHFKERSLPSSIFEGLFSFLRNNILEVSTSPIFFDLKHTQCAVINQPMSTRREFRISPTSSNDFSRGCRHPDYGPLGQNLAFSQLGW